MAASDLVGAWRMVGSEFRYDDGTVIQPYGTGGAGLLIYTPDGWMSAQIMRADRKRFATADRLGGSAQDVQEAFAGYRAYCGTYQVDAAAQTVTHRSEINLLPNEVGVPQVRHYSFEEGRLILTTPPMLMGGRLARGRLIWERVPQSMAKGGST